MIPSPKTALFILALSSSVFFSSCGGSSEEETTSTDTTAKVEDQKSGLDQEMIGIPSPSDMLGFIRMTTKGVQGNNTAFLNPYDNLKNYRDSKSMALNFGIYSCDLSYCSIFGNGTAAQEYFKAAKTLGEEVGVSSVVTPEMMKRAESNLKYPDSLVVIADELYFSASEVLEKNGKGPNLALVIAGGYVESLHIAANIIQFDAKSPALNRFADQKYVLEDVILYMRKFESDPGVSESIKKMEELTTAFNQIQEKKVEAPKADSQKGKKRVFGGGTVLEMNKEQFTSIATKIKEVRNAFAQIK
ncbi:MAG: hypothetical protein ACK5AY_01575 [Bacteroidota bacterium]|jgi:hypothetical protein